MKPTNLDMIEQNKQVKPFHPPQIFYSFPLLRPYQLQPLPPVKPKVDYSHIKSRVNSNYKPVECKKPTGTELA